MATTDERIGKIIDHAMKNHPRSPGVTGDIGLGLYLNDGHWVLFHRGDKEAIVHASNKQGIKALFGMLVDELALRSNAETVR